MTKNPRTRLTIEQVKKHPFFSKIKFNDLLAKKIKSPCKPTVKASDDLRNFDKKILVQNVLEGSPKQTLKRSLSNAEAMAFFQQERFANFSVALDNHAEISAHIGE